MLVNAIVKKEEQGKPAKETEEHAEVRQAKVQNHAE